MDELVKRIEKLEERVNQIEKRICKDSIEILLDDFTAGMFINDDIGETDLDDTY